MFEPDAPVTWYLKQTGKTCWRIVSRERWTSHEDAEAALRTLESTDAQQSPNAGKERT